MRLPARACLDSLLLAYTMLGILVQEQEKYLGGTVVHKGSNLASERITIVMVTYNSASLISNAFINLQQFDAIVVVDNASTDHSVDTVRDTVPHARIIINKVNEGFGKAANRAFNEVMTEFALLVSPDCSIDGAVIKHLLILADRWDNAALVSPSLVDENGVCARCHDRDLFSRRGLKKNRTTAPIPSGTLCAGFVQNAASLVRMEAVKEVRFYDEKIFLFYEDDDLCIRLRDKGWSLILTPDVSAVHLPGTSSTLRARFLTSRRYYHMAWSRAYLEGKYRGKLRGIILGITRLSLFLSKFIVAILFLNQRKIVRDGARIMGTAGYIFGRSAHGPDERNK